MNDRQSANLDAFHRVQWFLDHHADALAGVDLAPLRAKLDLLVSRLDGAATDQADFATRAESLTKYKNELRRRLYTLHMEPIVTFARAQVAGIPEMATLRMPPRAISDSGLISAGMGMANAAADYRDRFLKLGMNPGFIEEFRASLLEFQQACVARDSCQAMRHGTTMTIAVEARIAWQLVRMMHVLIRTRSGANPALLAGWREGTLHAPRLRAPDSVKLLPAGTPTASTADAAAEGQLDGTPAQVVQPAPVERASFVRRVLRDLSRGSRAA
jgi:hypothetical protein